eukprot:TRINITY_DN25316_c0_g1_i1.p1 TRINITY_DN25316_c0_g1~~TRINITY_DN25316_c0_g1_i1.p1  ORF type:complete len:279 (-),score=34.16 TRINITY_DN25316_c0_g1_i1:117-833(-)
MARPTDSQSPIRPLLSAGGLSVSSSATRLRRDDNDDGMPKTSLYEVTTGLACIRSNPSVHGPTLAILRGGHKFYATPYSVNGYIWLKLDDKDVAPPCFSPTGHANSLDKTVTGTTKQYYCSLMPTAFSTSDLHASPEAWIREEKHINCIRAARKTRKPPDPETFGQTWGQTTNRGSFEELHREVRKVPVMKPFGGFTIDEWSKESGKWVNFGQYGSVTVPANDNCGRWRQLGTGSVMG